MSGHMGKSHFLERRGEGVGIILRASAALSGTEPVYVVRDEELCLTVFNTPVCRKFPSSIGMAGVA